MRLQLPEKNQGIVFVVSLGESAQRLNLSPVLCAILMLYWLWINVGFQCTTFLTDEIAEGEAMALWLIPAASALVVYLTLAIFHRRFDAAFGTRIAAFSAGIVAAIGALLETIRIIWSASSTVLLIGGGVLIGAGTPLMLMCIATIFSWLEPKALFLQIILAAACAALLCALAARAPQWLLCCALCAIPLLIGAALQWAVAIAPAPDSCKFDRFPIFPTKIFATSVVHGIALGSLFGLSIAGNTLPSALNCLAASCALAAVLLFVLTVFARMDYNSLLYRIAFMIVALGAVCTISIPNGVAIGAFLQMAGFSFLHLVMWGLNCSIVRSFNVPILWLVGLGTAGCMLGELSAGIASRALVEACGSTTSVNFVEGGLIIVLMATALTLSDSRNLKDGWSLAKPSSFRPTYATLDSAVEHLASDAGLSPREKDVFSLLARGRNRKAIAEALVLSEETVKSHTSSIYRKLLVHSQQELINKVERDVLDNQEE